MGNYSLRASVICLAGLAARGMGYPDLAARILARATAMVPENPVFHYELGVAHMKRHALAEAETSFRRALEIKPDMGSAFSGLGDIARVRDNIDQAVTQYEKALALDPDLVGAHYGLGVIHRDQWRLEAATPHFRRTLDLDPGFLQAGRYLDDIIAYQKELKAYIEENIREACNRSEATSADYKLASALYRAATAGMRDWALLKTKEWKDAVPQNEVAVHAYMCLEGTASPPAMSPRYVEKTFDVHAESFDKNLRLLSYQGPDLIAGLIARYFPDSGLDILDVGCGTGLGASALKPYAGTLTGVDLSAKMLEVARERGLYDQLHKSDIVSFLRGHHNSYDLIAASDVFCYFGELSEVVAGMAIALRKSGRVAFTVEHDKTGSESGWRLQPHGRYCHTEAYVREKVKAAGLTLVAIETGLLRQELFQNVEALAVLARKEF